MWLLVTGTGRCGTGYMAQVLTSAGVNCSHEGVFSLGGWKRALEAIETRRRNPAWGWQADSSWLAAPFLDRPELAALTVVHLARHPKQVMDSHLRLILHGDISVQPFYRWMRERLPELDLYDDPVDKAALWYIRLNEMVERRADLFHRVESPATNLLDKLGIDWQGKELFDDKSYNARPGYGPSDVQPEDISQPLRGLVADMARHYGYEWPTGPGHVEAGWFGERRIEIDARSARMGGAWQMHDEQGRPVCYDSNLVQFFYDKVKDMADRPVVVDVGASTGNFALLGKIIPMVLYCFEPNPEAAKSLRVNLDINGVKAEVHDFALLDRDGTGELVVPTEPIHAALACLSDGTFRRDYKVRKVSVEVRQLDSLGLPKVDALKIDVEGAELPVLRGAEQTINRDHPAILVEFSEDNTRQFGYEPDAIQDWLEAHGYDQFQRVGIEDLWAESSRR